MNRKILLIASAFTLVFSAVACSSGGTGTTSTGAGGSTATATGAGGSGGDATPAASCIKPGDKGNDKGVGTYCTPGGGECAAQTVATVCLADFGQDQWFCTKLSCTMDGDCGTAAVCHKDPAGAACVPRKCEEGTGGAGGGGGGK